FTVAGLGAIRTSLLVTVALINLGMWTAPIIQKWKKRRDASSVERTGPGGDLASEAGTVPTRRLEPARDSIWRSGFPINVIAGRDLAGTDPTPQCLRC